MLNKSLIKFIKSLQLKKYRTREGFFVVEGEKSVLETISSAFSIEFVVATPNFIHKYKESLANLTYYEVSAQVLSQLGSFKTNDAALAVVKQEIYHIPKLDTKKWYLALDSISDPGNFGTMMRIADWYGIGYIFAGENTIELYNPKVISGSMGSFARVRVVYTNLNALMASCDLDIYGAYLEGGSVYDYPFTTGGILVMGNESRGIDEKYLPFIKHKITIPGHGGAESLNVAVSTGIILDNIVRSIRSN